MSCMCGDLYCGSCGSAQGNGRCHNCGAWALDGGCKDPKACAEADAALVEAEAREAEDLQHYWESQP